MSEHKPNVNNNRISNIAHFFLSDLSNNDVSHPYPPTPQRTDQPEMTDPSYFSKCNDGNGNGRKVELIGVICSHLKWQAMGALREFARTLAKKGKKVGVLNLQSWAAQLNIYHKDIIPDEHKGKETRQEYFEEPIKSLRSDKHEDNGKIDILKCLDEYSLSIDCLLLMFGPEFNNYSRDLFASLDCVCVITNSQRERIISAYQAIKGISSNNDVRVGVFIVGTDSEESAKKVYSRLSQTAREHIGAELSYLGCSVSETPVISEMIARQQLRTDSTQSTEDWIARLKGWLEEHKSEKEEMTDNENVRMTETLSNKEQAKSNVNNFVTEEKRLHNEEKNMLKISELVGEERQFLALHIGKKLLGQEYKADGSELIDFLRKSGFCCARFLSKDNGKSCFVIVFEKEQDKTIVDWILDNYPHKSDELIIVSSVQLGYLETHSWRKLFSNLRIIPMLKGGFEGENVIILSY